ncbi:MAG: metallophosphoesterase [Polyangia bacterium]|jgi:hypothetical protein|nr:metallophosphoesterase [Polyangia bacterium]
MTSKPPAPPPRGINRRDLLRLGGAGLGGLALANVANLGGCDGASGGDGRFRFAILADTHIIDPFYTGPEGSPEDTESIFHTRERLEAARAVVNSIRPRVELAFVCGDVVHNYPSADWDFYFENETRFDIARSLLDGFEMPVHIGLGNHDYDIGDLPREFTHELFREKFDVAPYYAVEHGGFAFLHLDNFLGKTCETGHADYNPDMGSLGATQLDWLEAELARGRPTFVFLHFPLSMIERREDGDRDLFGLLRAHQDSIQRVVAGHWHLWMDYEESYGPPHLLCASTRYDADAFLVVEADPRTATHRILNWDHLTWFAHDTEPWEEPG